MESLIPSSSSALLRPLTPCARRGDGVPVEKTPAPRHRCDGEFARRYKKLTKLVVTLNNHPKIKAWNAAKNPKLPWYEPGV